MEMEAAKLEHNSGQESDDAEKWKDEGSVVIQGEINGKEIGPVVYKIGVIGEVEKGMESWVESWKEENQVETLLEW